MVKDKNINGSISKAVMENNDDSTVYFCFE